MTILKDYKAFDGGHYETGTLHNILAYQGVKAPHTGKAISEALLLGVSGGITVGYFTFEYSGYLPHIALLTRNTFAPLETIFDRLSLSHETFQTTNPEKAVQNLLEVLEDGRAALVWADMFTMPYRDLPFDDQHWAMLPLVVYGYDDGIVYIADGANQPLKVPADVFEQARARIKKDKFRVISLDTPNLNHLATAVSKGIWQCINLFTEAPPKGKRDNFGLAALQFWANMLTNTRNKQSWERYFPPGERLWMALVGDTVQPGAFSWINQGVGNSAERGMYADFLNEAALILNKPDLQEAGHQFRQSERAWHELAQMLLPDDNAICKEAKTLLRQKRQLFIDKGSAAFDEIKQINSRLKAIHEQIAIAFPMNEPEVKVFREGLAAQVLKIHDIERDTILYLQKIMA